MDEINDSNSHLYDGVDIDAPAPRPLSREAWQWACNARKDWKELKSMTPEELRRYCGHQRRHNGPEI